MSSRTSVSRRVLLASALGLALPGAVFAQCPTAEQVSKKLEEVFKQPGIQVKKVQPAAVKGLCEVQIVAQRQGSVLYTDAAGAHFIVNGIVIDIKNGRNLTAESVGALNEELAALNVIPPEEMKKVEALVAMTVGTKGPAVYFVTDPM